MIDEALNVGKGANSIISMLHHFFEVHGLGEACVCLHADNCGGQNKNKHMINYLNWRVKSGLHDEITYLLGTRNFRQTGALARCNNASAEAKSQIWMISRILLASHPLLMSLS